MGLTRRATLSRLAAAGLATLAGSRGAVALGCCHRRRAAAPTRAYIVRSNACHDTGRIASTSFGTPATYRIGTLYTITIAAAAGCTFPSCGVRIDDGGGQYILWTVSSLSVSTDRTMITVQASPSVTTPGLPSPIPSNGLTVTVVSFNSGVCSSQKTYPVPNGIWYQV